MGISGIGQDYYQNRAAADRRASVYDAAGKSFAGQMAHAAENGLSPAAVLHGNEEDTGEIAISSDIDFVNGVSLTVYKPKDFAPENPIYKVKIWDKAGNVTERMVDVSGIDTENCDTVEMYAYTSYLKDTGKGDFKETVLKTAVAKAVKNAEQKNAGPWKLSEKIDWVKAVRDIMQSVYEYGDLQGYLGWKRFLGFLEK